jgi:hypothetical protein
MNTKRYEGGFKEVKKLNVMDTREGEELHFTKVEVDGKIRGDIRYFTLREGRMKPARRGLLIPDNTKEFESNVQNLIKSLSEK